MSLLSRGFTAIALVAACTGIMAPPASATQTATAQLSTYLPEVLLGAGSNGTVERLYVGSPEPVTATHLRIEIDVSELAGVATVSVGAFWPTTCSTSGAVTACVRDEVRLDSPFSVQLELTARPAAGAVAGAAGNWRVTVSADGLATVSTQAKVEVAEGVDLAAHDNEVSLGASPGSLIVRPLMVDNVGQRTADGAVLVFYGDYAFITTSQYNNCTFVDNRPRTCTFNEQLAPGRGYETGPIPFKLREDTFAPGNELLEYEWMTKADFAVFNKRVADQGNPDWLGQPGTGGRLALSARPGQAAGMQQTDTNPTNDFGHVHVDVSGDNGADFAAIGGARTGFTGQIVTVNVGIRNFGPATRDISRAGGGATFDFKLPQGTSLVEMPAGCHAMKSSGPDGEWDPDLGNLAARFIRCENPSAVLVAGTEVTFAVRLRINRAMTNASGSVSVLTDGCDGCMPDKVPGNDIAGVVLNPASPPAH